jgi:predicted metal-dependent hydrolase
MGLKPSSVAFRRYKSRWGCCDKNDRLTFNTALIRYAPELIDYVVVHELAHIRHKDHSKAFWNLVMRYLPDAKALRRRLV